MPTIRSLALPWRRGTDGYEPEPADAAVAYTSARSSLSMFDEVLAGFFFEQRHTSCETRASDDTSSLASLVWGRCRRRQVGG